jgi:hypothetical protein
VKRQVDVERFVQWAVNDQFPKGLSVTEPIWNAIESSARIGKYTRGDEHTASDRSSVYLSGEPHPDAKRLAGLLRDMNAPVGLSEAEARDLLGPELRALDPNAVLAAMVRRKLAPLIISRAVLKAPPPLDLRLPQPKPVTRGTNQHPLVLRKDADGNAVEVGKTHWRPKEKGNLVGEPWCPIEWRDPMVELIADQRAEYVIWWNALADLASRLCGLTDYVLTGPAREARPWLRKCPFRAHFPAASRNIEANY